MNKENPRRFKELSTEELDNLLNTELEKEKIDRTTVIEILRTLEEREADKPVELTEEVVRAWESYQNAPRRKSTIVRKHSLWITRVAAIFVVISVLLVSIPAVAGLGFFETIAQWTADIFKFSGTPIKTEVPEDYVFETDNPDLQKVYDAVCEMGIKHPVVPMWLPKGYTLIRLAWFEENDSFVAEFRDGSEELVFSVRKGKQLETSFTKDDGYVEEYTKGTVKHYIVKNEIETKIAWVAGDRLGNISCSAQDINVHDIINSIYS